MRCVTKNGTTQNWIESNNLYVVIWCILLSIKKIQQTAKCRLCKKVGNLAFALSANWLLINTFVSCINFRLFGFSLRACLTETIISSYNLQLCLTEVVMFPATRSLSAVFLSSQTARLTVQRNYSGNQGIIRCRAEVGGQSDGKPEGPDVPL